MEKIRYFIFPMMIISFRRDFDSRGWEFVRRRHLSSQLVLKNNRFEEAEATDKRVDGGLDHRCTVERSPSWRGDGGGEAAKEKGGGETVSRRRHGGAL